MATRKDHDRPARADEAYRAGDFPTALRLYEPLAKRNPAPDVLERVGMCYAQLGRVELAYKYMKRSAEMKPNPGAYCNLAVAAQMSGRFSEAGAALKNALKLDPENKEAIGRTGNLHLLQGDGPGAFEFLRPYVARGEVNARIAVIFARAARSAGLPDEGIRTVESSLASAQTDKERSDLLFALGDLLDAAGEYDRAFAAYEEANTLRPLKFDRGVFAAQIDRIIATWTKEAYAAAPRSRVGSDQPVFIVGMPRSGTSLVEQILATHPDVFGAGELGTVADIYRRVHAAAKKQGVPGNALSALTSKSLDTYGRECLGVMTRQARSAKRITDKMPENVLHLGLISLMLPRARVIHCVREPLDTCLSCYFQSFGGSMQPFAYDLEDLGAYYKGYRRAIEHWHATLDLPILDVSYETLVANQEAESRRIFEFIGLDWNDECMRFHETARPVITASTEQVRRPMYTSSVARFKNYEKHLWGLKNALE